MTLGEKLKTARLESGLSQRQLCGDMITRNMLSQIEHGTARPSMDTLRYLADRLGKPVSFFLEEESVVSPNQSLMEEARRSFQAGEFARGLETLEAYRGPDPVYDRERELLEQLLLLELARQAVQTRRFPYARELLSRVVPGEYCREALLREKSLLLASLRGEDMVSACKALPSLDGELLLRTEAALREGEFSRAEYLLQAMETHGTPCWNRLMGEILMGKKAYAEARSHLQKAQEAGTDCLALLETCCRELGDFEGAYRYACRQRERK